MGGMETIVAVITPPGTGAVGMIRLSGPQALEIADRLFYGKKLSAQRGHTAHFGTVRDQGAVVDEVLATVFRAPNSFTGEDSVELGCHGSPYLLEKVVSLCLAAGARPAKAGEFTMRAFLNGKMDLAQAEAVADLIASESGAAHEVAVKQLRGGFSAELRAMREELIRFSALIELELDFSEEDVDFADRATFRALLEQLERKTQAMLDSFRLGNVIKKGVHVAIVGKPNAGKSTLLNALLQEERAIVSEVAGTTRDTIEEVLNIHGMLFRLMDTAGIRAHTSDRIEQLGMERSLRAMEQAEIIVELEDVTAPYEPIGIPADATAKRLRIGNKADRLDEDARRRLEAEAPERMLVSAQSGEDVQRIKEKLYGLVAGSGDRGGTIVTSVRHVHALEGLLQALRDVRAGLDNRIPGDLLSLDIRAALHRLGEITGDITTEDKLDYIFSKFCIGK